ncbi:heterokaryon incompatibility protein-domain-containing protein [Ustulina deusta]|nr:heterokaryon incompatibility protein-domain-containing protein [Ustulina deusta]
MGRAKLYGDVDRGQSVFSAHNAEPRDALRCFRLPSNSRRLWVDAVYINQKDEEEKGKQIPFMDVIYRGASAVLVWLGNYPTQAACLRSIKAYPHLVSKERGPNSRVGRQKHSELPMSIYSLVQLPWFSRRWIVQEAVLNPDVLLCCCDEELSCFVPSWVTGFTTSCF